MESLIAPTVNLLILVGALIYYLRQPMKDFVHNRHLSLSEEIRAVREQLERARATHGEYSSKLSAMDREIADLQRQIREDAQSAKNKIIEEARRLAANVMADAKSGVQALYSELKSDLYGELGHKVIERAEVLMRERLTGDDKARIRHEFSAQIQNAPATEVTQ